MYSRIQHIQGSPLNVLNPLMHHTVFKDSIHSRGTLECIESLNTSQCIQGFNEFNKFNAFNAFKGPPKTPQDVSAPLLSPPTHIILMYSRIQYIQGGTLECIESLNTSQCIQGFNEFNKFNEFNAFKGPPQHPQDVSAPLLSPPTHIILMYSRIQ